MSGICPDFPESFWLRQIWHRFFFTVFFFEDFILTFIVFDANHSGLAEFFVEGIGDELLTPVGYFNYLLAVKKVIFLKSVKSLRLYSPDFAVQSAWAIMPELGHSSTVCYFNFFSENFWPLSSIGSSILDWAAVASLPVRLTRRFLTFFLVG